MFKRLAYIVGILALLTACQKKAVEPVHIPAVNAKTVTPMPDESGSVKAFIGTTVKASGFNLDRVSSVTIGGVQAEILSQSIKEIEFTVPALELAQSDNPHLQMLEIFSKDSEEPIFKCNYFITVPVTDALVSGFSPASGTAGTVVTVSGRNLDQITGIDVNGKSVSVDDLTIAADKVQFPMPAVEPSGASTSVAIAAYWVGGTIDVTDQTPFEYLAPVFSALSQSAPAKIGDEFTLTGENLDLVDALTWNSQELLILSKEAKSLSFKIPSAIEKTEPAVKAANLVASYGTPAQSVNAGEFSVDTTPMGPAKPAFTSIANVDAAYSLFYLGKELVVKGENMATVEKFSVDGIDAPLVGAATDVEAHFVMPSTISGTAKKDVALVAYYNSGEVAFTETISVLPFYYTKGLKICTGSNSKSTYPAANAEAAFLLLNEGRVASVSEWKTKELDPFALQTTNSVITAAGKTAAGATAQQYYSVQPYYFLTASSAHKLAFQNPANSASQLKTFFLDGVALSATYGTPSIYARIITDNADFVAAAKAGTVTDILSYTTLAGSAAPAFGTAEGSTWVAGSVLGIQYVNFAHAHDTGGKPTAMENVCRQGFIVIKSVGCGDPATGLALTTREGYIEFDLYWSNELTK
ncbi:MAG: IPT/TIG domain-containing protein [Bacteroidales bacterium]|nr:IPT/TIG domain-containing protein [Bacteroidales bacterium]